MVPGYFFPGGYTSVSCSIMVFYCEDEQNYSILLCAKKYFKTTVLSDLIYERKVQFGGGRIFCV